MNDVIEIFVDTLNILSKELSNLLMDSVKNHENNYKSTK